jgi:hypothetical protein
VLVVGWLIGENLEENFRIEKNWKFRGKLQNREELSAIPELTFDGPLLGCSLSLCIANEALCHEEV